MEYLQNQEKLRAEGLLEKPARPMRSAPKLDVTSELAAKQGTKTEGEAGQNVKREKRQHKPYPKKDGEKFHKTQKPRQKPAEALPRRRSCPAQATSRSPTSPRRTRKSRTRRQSRAKMPSPEGIRSTRAAGTTPIIIAADTKSRRILGRRGKNPEIMYIFRQIINSGDNVRFSETPDLR
jgi:hypothetical protein